MPEIGCQCLNPVVPIAPEWIEQWTNVTNQNIALVDKAIARPIQLDVVFLGDSITEHWNGRDNGKMDEHNVSVVFQELFQKDNGGTMEGLALGVAGDRVSVILDELPLDVVIDVDSNQSFILCRHNNCSIVFNTGKCHQPSIPKSGGY